MRKKFFYWFGIFLIDRRKGLSMIGVGSGRTIGGGSLIATGVVSFFTSATFLFLRFFGGDTSISSGIISSASLSESSVGLRLAT